MSDRLFERYFPLDEEQADEQIKAEWSEKANRLESLVNSTGWGELKSRVDGMIERSEILPSDEKTMLYQIGRREALREFRDLLRVMEEELRDAKSQRS